MTTQQILWAPLLCTLLLLTACTESPAPAVRIAHTSWPGYEPLVLALHQEFYQGVRVTDFRVASATDAIVAFEHHLADVAALTLDEALLLQSRYPEPLAIIAVLDISNGGDAIIAQGNLHSIDELQGKRVGVETTALGAYFLTRALETAATIGLEQLQLVPVKFNQHQDAFLSGQVDAVVTYEPAKSALLKRGGHNIFDSSRLPNEIVDVLVVSKSYAEARAESLRQLLSGYIRALRHIKADGERYIPIMAGLEGVSANEFRSSLAGISTPDLELNHRLLGGAQPELIDTMERVMHFMVRNKIIRGEQGVSLSVTNHFLPALNDD